MPVEAKEVFISYAHGDYGAVLDIVAKLLKLLRAAGKLQFKASAVSPFLRTIGAAAGAAAVAGLLAAVAWGLLTLSAETLATALKVFAAALALAALEISFSFGILRRKPVDYLINLFILTVGFPAALLRLLITDKVYLRRGSLSRLLRLSRSPDV
jgi:hypothetical protein